MCGRYVLHLRPSQVRHVLEELLDMPVDEAPDDDDEPRVRQSYNFAPTYHGLIYRASLSETEPENEHEHEHRNDDAQRDDTAADEQNEHVEEPARKRKKLAHPAASIPPQETTYKLQSAKWGLIPFWTKRPPDYASQLKTINCRSESLLQNHGLWNAIKRRKRCVVLAEGFYEWLKKPNTGGKVKVPHFVKRADGGLMCMAGLWDCVKYEGREEVLRTYTIVTTDSNKQLSFLHDRMPVILEPGSVEMRTWLDPGRREWDAELQGLLRPFTGVLECYAVDQAVGKVGNDSPGFVVPVASKENKKNIANFFDKQETGKDDPEGFRSEGGDNEATATEAEDPESNAPLPKPKDVGEDEFDNAMKHGIDGTDEASPPQQSRADRLQMDGDRIRREVIQVDETLLLQAADSPTKKRLRIEESSMSPSPTKVGKDSTPGAKRTPSQKTRSATSNGTVGRTPTKETGERKITAFFGK